MATTDGGPDIWSTPSPGANLGAALEEASAMPTQIRENHAKPMLKNDELVLCFGVNRLRTPNIAMPT